MSPNASSDSQNTIVTSRSSDRVTEQTILFFCERLIDPGELVAVCTSLYSTALAITPLTELTNISESTLSATLFLQFVVVPTGLPECQGSGQTGLYTLVFTAGR
ncbi:hypothetical protein [Endozoicomonas sp. 2B-B]